MRPLKQRALNGDRSIDENLNVLREGCLKYFERGGECISGPVALLSGYVYHLPVPGLTRALTFERLCLLQPCPSTPPAGISLLQCCILLSVRVVYPAAASDFRDQRR